jgi:DUF4097 and DUF4098 domain-containing protein YvlB
MKRKWLIAGALLLAELALCAGIIGVFWATIGAARLGLSDIRIGDARWLGFNANAVSVEADESQTFAVGGPAKLEIGSDSRGMVGEIVIIGGSGDEIVVEAHKVAWGANQTEAENALAELKVKMNQNGDTVTVDVERPRTITFGNEGQADRVDLTITAPIDTEVVVRTNFGEITLSGTEGDVDVESDFGTITITDVKAGDLTARTNAGEVKLQNVEATGAVTLDADAGEVRFQEGSAETLTVATSAGQVKLSDLTIQDTVSVQADFGEVSLEAVTAKSYDLKSNAGAITLVGASGLIKAHTDFGDVEVLDATDSVLDLKTNSGTVRFSGTLGAGSHELKSDFGNINIALPEDVELDFDLKTDFGKINSELPIAITGAPDEAHWVGAINGGGPDLTAKTNSGNISIEILK